MTTGYREFEDLASVYPGEWRVARQFTYSNYMYVPILTGLYNLLPSCRLLCWNKPWLWQQNLSIFR